MDLGFFDDLGDLGGRKRRRRRRRRKSRGGGGMRTSCFRVCRKRRANGKFA